MAAGLALLAVLVAQDGAALARQHYARGEQHFDALRYDEAVAQYEAAYRLKPHPSVLWIIGLCHERAFRFRRAVEYYDRYLAEGGERGEFAELARAHREWLLSRKARVKVTSNIDGAVVALRRDDGRTFSGAANGRAQPAVDLEVPAGRYVLEVSAPTYVTWRQPLQTEIGQPYNFHAELTKQLGRLSIAVDPPDARILLDSRDIGTGRYYDRDHPVGLYNLRLEHPDRSTIEAGVELTPDRELVLQVALPPRRRSGRLELVLGGGVYGGWLLAAGFRAADVTDPFVIAPVAAGGAALGVLASTLVTNALFSEAGPTQGTASFVAAGPLWGTIYGFAVDEAVHDPADPEPHNSYRWGVGGGLLGLALTLTLAGPVDSTPGDSALIHSGAGMGVVAGLLGAQALTGTVGTQDVRWLPLVGINVGLAAGLGVSAYTEWSRAHVALIDAAAVAGLALGAGIERVVQPSGRSTELGRPDDRTARFALVGGLAGLVVGVIATRNYDRPALRRPPRPLDWLRPAAYLDRSAEGNQRLWLAAGGIW
jgi:hypothetical protein